MNTRIINIRQINIQHKTKTGWHTIKPCAQHRAHKVDLLSLEVVRAALLKKGEYRYCTDGGRQHQFRLVLITSDRDADANFFRNCAI